MSVLVGKSRKFALFWHVTVLNQLDDSHSSIPVTQPRARDNLTSKMKELKLIHDRYLRT